MAENYFWKRSTYSAPTLKLLASIAVCRNQGLLNYTQTYNPRTGYAYPKSVRLYLRQMRYASLAELQMPILNELLQIFQGKYFTAIAGGYAVCQVGWTREFKDVDLYVCVPAVHFDNDIEKTVKETLTTLQGIHPELDIGTLMTYRPDSPKMRIIRIRDEVERARDLFGRSYTPRKAFDVVFLRTTVDLTDDFYTLSRKVVQHFDLQISKCVGLPIYIAEGKSGILFFPLEYSKEFVYDYDFVECARLSKISRFFVLNREVYMNHEVIELKVLKNILKSLDFANETLLSTYRICTLLTRWKKYNERIKSSLRLLSCDELRSTLAINAFLERELMTWC